jgi:hypothetical protein
VRAHEGRLAVDYLREVLARIGPVLPQEVPDDPATAQPYVHFEHPLGRVVVARATEGIAAGDPPRWHVARETVEALRPLFAAFEGMPPDPEAAAAAPPPSGFFALRQWIGSRAPMLLLRLGPVEAWQILGIAAVVLAGWVLGWLAGWPAVALLRLGARMGPEEAAHPLAGAACGGERPLARRQRRARPAGDRAGGDAPDLHHHAGPRRGWGGWHLVDGLARRLGERAQRSSTQVDEIMVSLVAGAAKVGLVVGACSGSPTALAVPVAGIIAGSAWAASPSPSPRARRCRTSSAPASC